MRYHLATLCLGLLLAASGGCQPVVPESKYAKLNQQWLDVQRGNTELKRKNELLELTIERQNRNIEELRALGERRLSKLFYVNDIRLGKYTGGLDTDGKDGDEAIKVYLDPVDQYGSLIKAAGDVKIQLFDLATPSGENLIGEYSWGVDEMPEHWSDALFGGSHFSFVCPWKQLPAHNQITVRVEFTDYLTGKTFTAQKVVNIRIPKALATQPASQPASEPSSQPESQPAE